MEIGGCGLSYLKTTLVQKLSSSVLRPSLRASCRQVPKQFKHSTDDLLWKGGEWKHQVKCCRKRAQHQKEVSPVAPKLPERQQIQVFP